MKHQVVCILTNKDGQALLARKKKKLGAGFYNAPGGNIEPGEDPLACAIRETQEETGITVHSARKAARVFMHFHNGTIVDLYYFITDAWSGKLKENDEFGPFQSFGPDELPLSEMWPSDRLFLGRLLKGERLTGHVFFNEDTSGVKTHTITPADW